MVIACTCSRWHGLRGTGGAQWAWRSRALTWSTEAAPVEGVAADVGGLHRGGVGGRRGASGKAAQLGGPADLGPAPHLAAEHMGLGAGGHRVNGRRHPREQHARSPGRVRAPGLDRRQQLLQLRLLEALEQRGGRRGRWGRGRRRRRGRPLAPPAADSRPQQALRQRAPLAAEHEHEAGRRRRGGALEGGWARAGARAARGGAPRAGGADADAAGGRGDRHLRGPHRARLARAAGALLASTRLAPRLARIPAHEMGYLANTLHHCTTLNTLLSFTLALAARGSSPTSALLLGGDWRRDVGWCGAARVRGYEADAR